MHQHLAERGSRAAKAMATLEIEDPDAFVKARKIVQQELNGELQAQKDKVAAEILGLS